MRKFKFIIIPIVAAIIIGVIFGFDQELFEINQNVSPFVEEIELPPFVEEIELPPFVEEIELPPFEGD